MRYVIEFLSGALSSARPAVAPYLQSDEDQRKDTARLSPQPKGLTAKNAESAKIELTLFAFFAFFCG